MGEEKETKIGMFGGGGVGKTAITLRYLKGEFTEGYIPTIEDAFTKLVDIKGESVTLTIIDTAGQDDFAEMRFSYYKQVQGYVLVFDISNPGSIDELRNMHNDIKDAVDGPVHCVVAANKADFRDDASRTDLVPTSKYKELETELNCKVLETSAKTGLNIEELYNTLVTSIKNPSTSKPSTEKKEPKKNDDGGSGGCCEIA